MVNSKPNRLAVKKKRALKIMKFATQQYFEKT